MRPLVAAADIGDIAQETGWPVAAMARLYHQVGAAFDFDRLRAAAGSIPSVDHFDRLAVRRLIEDLMTEQATLTRAVARASDASVGISEDAAEGAVDASRVAPFAARFHAARRDDLNAPQALATALEVARSSELQPAEKRALLLEFDGWLGLDLVVADPPEEATASDPRIDGLLAQRDAARTEKDWAEADRIRDALAAEGIEIVDSPEGSRWRRR